MSSLSRLMILLSPATTDKENTRVNFKWFSMKTLVFSLCYIGLGAAPFLVSSLTGFTSHLVLDQTKNIIDTGSQFATLAALSTYSTFPFVLTTGVPAISGLALAKDLTSPKYGLIFILGIILAIFVQISGNAQLKNQPNVCSNCILN